MASVTRTAVLAYRVAVHEVQTAAATADDLLVAGEVAGSGGSASRRAAAP